MLRTRRRDNNVKPNRRLDRKSSRGMLYENEELRLKTININAEIERGQSDIKKLKRENEMLKKEIWCLRDEYDKLDKLLKDKKIDFSSSSTTYSSSSGSESESCSSCTEESEEVETSQNIKNVQKTNLKNIHDQFDHLSIVTEETSCENSDKNSTRHSIANDQANLMWNYNDKDVIKPDQSYPVYDAMVANNIRSQTLPNQMQQHMNYFSPIQHSKSFDDNHFSQVHHQEPLYPGDFYTPPPTCQPSNNMPETLTPPIAISPSPPLLYENQQVIFPERTDARETENFLSKKIVHTNANNIYQNMVLVPKNLNPHPEAQGMEKKATDLIVKIDNQNFNKNLTYSNTTPSTTFSNGGNLEELLHDIESISQRGMVNPHQLPTIQEPGYGQDTILGHLINHGNLEEHRIMSASEERLHKSELNVVLMPKAMPLIGFDKYKNIQRSLESLNSKHIESMSASQQNLCVLPPESNDGSVRPNLHVNLPPAGGFAGEVSPNLMTEKVESGQTCFIKEGNQDHNPFFFGNLNDNYVNSDYFSRRYNPDNFIQKDEPEEEKIETPAVATAEHNSNITENEENIKLKTSKPENKDKKQETNDKKQEQAKTPKMSITRKVSIHFKGKKEKDRLKKLALGGNSPESKTTPKNHQEKKFTLSDFKVNSETPKVLDKNDTKDIPSSKTKDKGLKQLHQKTPSIDSKKSTTETSNFEPKTPNSSESDKKKDEKKKEEKKSRKSVSVSPDRAKHVHMMHDGQVAKKHKKHRRERSGASRMHRGSMDPRLRERSYSICTDRSMGGGGNGYGMGYGSFLYEDYSDRERTNSGSSCESHDHHRKMSGISNVPLNGKLPWCGCWGNGCL